MKDLKLKMSEGEEIFWINPNSKKNSYRLLFSKSDIDEAEARLIRFSSYIRKAFPETEKSDGIIESDILPLKTFGSFLNLDNPLYLKMDSELPISGSVKARGGIYEVLKFAEEKAIASGMLSKSDDYSKLMEPEFKDLFSNYEIAVGSTGNLGLSIGIISAKLGFTVTVHMSSDARQWKKELLKEKGVTVIEYADDYQKAVSEGRRLAASNPKCHFIDDENSSDLFLGYSVAGKRLYAQLKQKGINIDIDNPLYIYIPCGVGGAPGGIAFGIKQYFGDNAHIYFAEPVNAPCMTLGLLTGLFDKISVSDIGLSGKTIADGLAVGRSSKLVGKMMESLIDGCYTVNDDKLTPIMKKLYEKEDIFIEHSACASFYGVPVVDAHVKKGIHLCWATGGSMVPIAEKNRYLNM